MTIKVESFTDLSVIEVLLKTIPWNVYYFFYRFTYKIFGKNYVLSV